MEASVIKDSISIDNQHHETDQFSIFGFSGVMPGHRYSLPAAAVQSIHTFKTECSATIIQLLLDGIA